MLISDEGHVRVLRLNRPARRNALSASLVRALAEAALDADEDPEVRVLVLTGTGQDAFCAGADLKDMGANDQRGGRYRPPMSRFERQVFEVVMDLKKPTIAALNGSAVAGGFELALACDLRIGHRDVKLGLPETKIGMGANFGSVVLPRVIPRAIALELLYTGEYIDAERGLALGLLNRMVEPSQVLPESLRLASAIAANAPISVRRVKAMALKGMELPIAAALRMDPGANPYLSEDRKEGIRARLDKRAPVWSNR
ncbi:MAG: enoyl-CoA hydratase/isomerase family protein [Rubrivivax sp.]|nr:MAG: enoyl-CoA hydratase/isomerase family protein [Rubrivivax sp.]